MANVTSLDYRKLLAHTTSEIFNTMLSMKVEAAPTKSDLIKDRTRIVGSVGFAGDVIGCMNIHVGDGFARLIAGTMLGEEPDKIGTEEVLDVVGELSNMIGGGIKSRLCDSGMPCSLSIPSTMSGSDFTVESHGWNVHESITFHSDGHFACVEVYVKSNNSI
jgi:chemotaxis protein CheX